MQGFWIYFFETPALTQLEIDYKLLKDMVFIVFQRALYILSFRMDSR